MTSHKLLVGLLVAALVMLLSSAAQAQIVHESPAQVKAANRRALREAQRTESPYKDSHLDVTRGRLKRGQSTQPLPEGSDELHYKTGAAPNVKSPGLLGLRRNKTSTLVRKEQHPKNKSAEKK